MKKILFITVGDVERGGVQKFLMDWIKAANKMQKYTYTWYCSGKILDVKLQREFEEQGVKIITGNLDAKSRVRYYYFMKTISCELNKAQYSIVHINTGVLAFAFFAVLAAGKKVGKIIVHSHSASARKRSWIEEKQRNALRRYIVKNATICAACSEKAAEWLFGPDNLSLVSWEYIKNRVDVSVYKFDEEKREIYRKKLGLDNQMLLGNVAQMYAVKNQDFLLELMKELKKQNVEDVKLIIIGTGPLEEKLRLKAEKYQLDDVVIFAGQKNNVNEWLQAMDIFVMPSISEGLPIAAIEAQASGLHCLLSDNFSKEIKVINKVEFMPLQHVSQWVTAIVKIKKENWKDERLKYSEDIIKAGFDSASLEKTILKIYE